METFVIAMRDERVGEPDRAHETSRAAQVSAAANRLATIKLDQTFGRE
jgi:hypothetical protein